MASYSVQFHKVWLTPNDLLVKSERIYRGRRRNCPEMGRGTRLGTKRIQKGEERWAVARKGSTLGEVKVNNLIVGGDGGRVSAISSRHA